MSHVIFLNIHVNDLFAYHVMGWKKILSNRLEENYKFKVKNNILDYYLLLSNQNKKTHSDPY